MSMQGHITRTAWILLALAAGTAGTSSAQIRIHRSLTVLDGLVQSQVNAILEDADGYLWLGTFGGVTRWDGFSCRNFETQDGLAGADVRVITQRNDGTLLFGTYDGGLSILREGGFSTVDADSGLSENSVRAIVEDEAGRLLVATGDGVTIYSPGDTLLRDPDYVLRGFSVSSLALLDGGRFCVATLSGELFVVTSGDASIPEWAGALPDRPIRHVHHSRDGTLYISLARAGLWTYRDGRAAPLDAQAELGGYDVKTIAEGENGEIYLGTIGGGVSIYRDGRLDSIRERNGLMHDTVWAVLPSSSGLVFFGTWAGLSIFAGDRFTTYDESTGLPDDVVLAVAAADDGAIHLGTASGGVAVLREGGVDVIDSSRGLSHDRVWSIEMTDDATYVGTSRGLSILTDDGVDVLGADREIPLRVYDIHVDSRGRIFVASYGGVYLLENGALRRVAGDGTSRTGIFYCIAEDPAGRLLFGSRFGYAIETDGTVTRCDPSDPLAGTHIWSIHVAADGTRYFGTNGEGLHVVRGADRTRLDVANGLSDNTVYGILEHEDGRLFLTTHRGVNVVRFEEDAVSIRVLDHHDGLASPECNQGAHLMTPEGQMWFGTIAGASRYDPSREAKNTTAPRLHVTRIRLFEDPIPLDRFRGGDFGHRSNYFTFDFVGINLTAPRAVRYRYHLSGVNRGWAETDHGSVQYTALDPGEYTIEIMACNEAGVWSEPVAMAFTIRPPFWNTWWFTVLVVLALGGAITAVVAGRVRHVLALERLRTRIAADLHDDIGAGLTEISILGHVISQRLPSESRAGVDREIARIGLTARELTVRMSDIVWVVSPQHESVRDLMTRLADSTHELAEGAGASFRLENVQALAGVKLGLEQRHNLLLVFKEAISNALKHSGAKELVLSAEIQGRTLEMSLADDGSGFDPDAASSGNGLRNMRERVRKLGGEIEITSTPGSGATVRYRGPA